MRRPGAHSLRELQRRLLASSRDKRKHIFAVYAFCRFVDDLGDEYDGDRIEALDAWEREVNLCYEGTPRHPYMVAMQETVRAFDIPREPFVKLIEANRMDQVNVRYETYEDLEHYCRHSANPVGQMVLYVFGYRDEERHRLSGYTCTALQLANFWQDVARDYAMGRIYIPQEDMVPIRVHRVRTCRWRFHTRVSRFDGIRGREGAWALLQGLEAGWHP